MKNSYREENFGHAAFGVFCTVMLILVPCVLALCPAVEAQLQERPKDVNLTTIKEQIDILQKQQQIILDQLSQLEGKLAASEAKTNGKPVVATTTDVGAENFRGMATAKVAMIEYGDFECPFCGQFEVDTFPKIVGNYLATGKVKYFYRDLPLSSHPHAILAARASHCAGDQGKYWEMYDALFANQKNFSDENFSNLAKSLGLDAMGFASCLAGDKFSAEVESSVSQAHELGITATPAFIIGTIDNSGNIVHIEKRIVGAVPYELLKSNLDELVAQP